MTLTPELAQYKDRLGGLPADDFIGSILWYSIAGSVDRSSGKREQIPVRVTRDQMTAWFAELGLDPTFLPPRILKVDAFRKATSAIKREYALPDERRAVLYVDEVDSNDDFVLRHVMRKVYDPRQQVDDDKLVADFVASLKFFRGGRTSMGKRATGDHYKSRPKPGLDQVDLLEVEALLEDVDNAYTDLSANLNEDKIRAVIRNYLGHLNAIAVKPQGAVYFVHNTRQDTLDALQVLVRRIGQGCSFEQIPLVDTGEQRTMLNEAFQNEVEDDVRLLLVKIATINEKTRGGPVKASVYAELSETYKQVAARSEEYAVLLDQAQGRAASALELALTSVMDLARRIDRKAAS